MGSSVRVSVSSSLPRPALLPLLLWSLILAELAGFVLVGSRLLGQPVVELDAMDEAVPCGGSPLVRADDIRAVNDAVRQSTQAFLVEHGVGGRVATVLYSYEDKLLVRNNIDRARLLQDPAPTEDVAEILTTRRLRVVAGVSQLLERELALDYEAALFAAWDQAWVEIEADLPQSVQPAMSLTQQIVAPAGRPVRAP